MHVSDPPDKPRMLSKHTCFNPSRCNIYCLFLTDGHILLLIHTFIDKAFTLIHSYLMYENQGHTPLTLFALLLLLALPLLLTFIKFVELLAFGERSHQLLAIMQNITNPIFLFIQAFQIWSYPTYSKHIASSILR